MRVIAGTARRLPLKTPPGMDTRPTTDRIKETLFNMLQSEIPNCTFIDLFSGSGAVGIEALSRGAKKAYFLDVSFAAISCIKENLAFTNFTNRAIVIKQDISSGLSSIGDVIEKGSSIDIIFLDPPYGQDLEKITLKLLSQVEYVDHETLIVVETGLHTDFSYASDLGFEILKEKKYKTNQHIFFKKMEE